MWRVETAARLPEVCWNPGAGVQSVGDDKESEGGKLVVR